jgi:basic membrane protein A and related proteins
MDVRRGLAAGATTVVLLFAALAAGCGDDDSGGATAGGGDGASGGDGGSVAYIHVKPRNSDSWETGGYEAVSAMAEKYGLELNEQVVSHDEAPSILRRIAPTHDLIIAHSSGYGDAMLEVAPEFPDTQFVVFSDLASTEGVENVAAWAINWSDMGYLGGTAACLAAQDRGSDTIGQVNSQPIPAFARHGGGAKQAADDLGCKYVDRWTNSFTDTAKAKQAALSMIAGGAEALLSSTDAADQGTREAVIEEDKLFVTNYAEADMELAPDNTITALTVNFDVAYDEIGELFTGAGIESKKYPVDIQTGGLGIVTPLAHVPDAVTKQVDDVLQKLKAGETSVDTEEETRP